MFVFNPPPCIHHRGAELSLVYSPPRSRDSPVYSSPGEWRLSGDEYTGDST
jgi:hypothetical protein